MGLVGTHPIPLKFYDNNGNQPATQPTDPSESELSVCKFVSCCGFESIKFHRETEGSLPKGHHPVGAAEPFPVLLHNSGNRLHRSEENAKRGSKLSENGCMVKQRGHNTQIFMQTCIHLHTSLPLQVANPTICPTFCLVSAMQATPPPPSCQ